VTYPYGQDLTIWFFPLVDDDAFVPSSTSQTPDIYVFASRPSRADALAGTGAIGPAITTWSWDAGRSGYSFTVPAIDDPDPTSTVAQATYYLGINVKLQATEQTQTFIQSIVLEKVTGHQTDVNVTLADMERYFPQAKAYSNEAQRLGYIAEAINEVQDKLLSIGYSWARINRPDKLERVVTLRALALLLLFQIQQGNDKFTIKYLELKQMASDAFDALKIEYDSDGDGEPDTETESNGMILLLR
jgi:hypothetical protein